MLLRLRFDPANVLEPDQVAVEGGGRHFHLGGNSIWKSDEIALSLGDNEAAAGLYRRRYRQDSWTANEGAESTVNANQQ